VTTVFPSSLIILPLRPILISRSVLARELGNSPDERPPHANTEQTEFHFTRINSQHLLVSHAAERFTKSQRCFNLRRSLSSFVLWWQ